MTDTPSTLTPLLTRWAIRVMVVSGLAIAYQSWAEDPVPWLWPMVLGYSVVMFVVWIGVWWLRQRRGE